MADSGVNYAKFMQNDAVNVNLSGGARRRDAGCVEQLFQIAHLRQFEHATQTQLDGRHAIDRAIERVGELGRATVGQRRVPCTGETFRARPPAQLIGGHGCHAHRPCGRPDRAEDGQGVHELALPSLRPAVMADSGQCDRGEGERIGFHCGIILTE